MKGESEKTGSGSVIFTGTIPSFQLKGQLAYTELLFFLSTFSLYIFSGTKQNLSKNASVTNLTIGYLGSEGLDGLLGPGSPGDSVVVVVLVVERSIVELLGAGYTLPHHRFPNAKLNEISDQSVSASCGEASPRLAITVTASPVS